MKKKYKALHAAIGKKGAAPTMADISKDLEAIERLEQLSDDDVALLVSVVTHPSPLRVEAGDPGPLMPAPEEAVRWDAAYTLKCATGYAHMDAAYTVKDYGSAWFRAAIRGLLHLD